VKLYLPLCAHGVGIGIPGLDRLPQAAAFGAGFDDMSVFG